MTMQLRVLTGTHAGARLDLAQGRYTLGSDPQTDIRIDDWPGCSLIIEVDQDGQIRYSSDTVPETSFVAFQPVRFGPLVLCIGDAGADWPDDVALLEQLLSPAPTPAPRTSRRKVLRTAVGAMLALSAAALIPSLQPAFLSNAATGQRPENAVNQAKALLKQLGFREAHAERVGTRVLIEGWSPAAPMLPACARRCIVMIQALPSMWPWWTKYWRRCATAWPIPRSASVTTAMAFSRFPAAATMPNVQAAALPMCVATWALKCVRYTWRSASKTRP